MSHVHDFTAARTSLRLKLLLCHIFYLNIGGVDDENLGFYITSVVRFIVLFII